MKRVLSIFSPFCLFLVAVACKAQTPAETFVSDLLSKMSLEEKIGQLTLYTSDMDVTGPTVNDAYKEGIKNGSVGVIFNAFTPAFTRSLQDLAIKNSPNKIPLLFGYDVIHGHRTIFPIPLAESSSWDLPLMEKSARLMTQEATADGIHWVFAPMVDIARDPRWGRISEGSGEDPWLGAKIAHARVVGIQGKSLSDVDSALASVKHFAAYGAAQGGRDYNIVNMSLPELFETYMPGYKAAAEAKAATFMTSFNEINGVPSTSNKWLINDVLRKQWGWDGFIVADYSAVAELMNHGTARDAADAAAQALLAGVDVDMQSGLYSQHLGKLLREGVVSMKDIDRAAGRVLKAKYDLGLFKDPYKNCNEERAQKVLMSPEHLKHASDIARKSIVLLKNDHALLPLQHHHTIALIGPMAANQRDQIGNWSAAGSWQNIPTLKDGMQDYIAARKLPTKILYAKGANLIDDPEFRTFLDRHGGALSVDPKSPDELIKEAVAVARKADVIVLAVGETQGMSGEAASRSQIRLPDNQLKLLRALAETKKPIALVLYNGRPLVLTEENNIATSILETWFLGTESGHAIADVLFGAHNPSGKLTVSFPYNEGQIPVFYGQRTTGRPIHVHDKYASRYLDVPNDALFPFGWGLSYTKFEYSPIKLSAKSFKPGQKLVASVTITNTGGYDGEETAQLYVRDMVASVTRPSLQLRNFKKVFLKTGQSQEISFEITEEDLKFYHPDLSWTAEPGDFKVFIGGNSRDLQSADFALE